MVEVPRKKLCASSGISARLKLREVEEYEVDFSNVTVLELIITPKYEWRSRSRLAQKHAPVLSRWLARLPPYEDSQMLSYAASPTYTALYFLSTAIKPAPYMLRRISHPLPIGDNLGSPFRVPRRGGTRL